MKFERVLPLIALASVVLFTAVADAGVWVRGTYYRPYYRPYYRGGVVIGMPAVVIGGPVYAVPVAAVQPVVAVPASPVLPPPSPPVPVR